MQIRLFTSVGIHVVVGVHMCASSYRRSEGILLVYLLLAGVPLTQSHWMRAAEQNLSVSSPCVLSPLSFFSGVLQHILYGQNDSSTRTGPAAQRVRRAGLSTLSCGARFSFSLSRCGTGREELRRLFPAPQTTPREKRTTVSRFSPAARAAAEQRLQAAPRKTKNALYSP